MVDEMTRVQCYVALLTVVIGGTSCSRKGVTPAGSPVPAPAPITDGRSLLGAMRDRYGGQWIKTLSFTQNNTQFLARGERKSQWRQQVSVPGKLRIDYLPLSDRSGVLFDGSRVHTFDNGRALDAQPGINPFLLLTADVYVLPLDRSARLVDSLGFDLGKLRRDTWEGRPVFVVGAAAGDSTSSQFWIDTDSLIARRVVQKERGGTREIVMDVRFSKFVAVGGFPVATEVNRYRDGRLVFREQYVDIRVNEPMADATFDAARWAASSR